MILGFIQNAVLNNSFATVEILRGIICDKVSSLQKNVQQIFQCNNAMMLVIIGQGQIHSE